MDYSEFRQTMADVSRAFRRYQRQGHADTLRRSDILADVDDVAFSSTDIWALIGHEVADFPRGMPELNPTTFRDRRRDVAAIRPGPVADRMRQLILPDAPVGDADLRTETYPQRLMQRRRDAIDGTVGRVPARRKALIRKRAELTLTAAIAALDLLVLASDTDDPELGAVARRALWPVR